MSAKTGHAGERPRRPWHWWIAGAAKRAATWLRIRLAGEDVRAARLATCLRCEHLSAGRCGICGCPARHKVMRAAERCPIGRWEAVAPERMPAAAPAERMTSPRPRERDPVLAMLEIRVAACLGDCPDHAPGWVCRGEPIAARLRDPDFVCPRGRFAAGATGDRTGVDGGSRSEARP